MNKITNVGSFSFGISYEKYDIAGKRNSNLKQDGNSHTLSFGHSLFENNIHEIYAGSAYTMYDPLGWGNYFITFFGSYTWNDSDINFYDSSIFSTGMGIGLTF